MMGADGWRAAADDAAQGLEDRLAEVKRELQDAMTFMAGELEDKLTAASATVQQVAAQVAE